MSRPPHQDTRAYISRNRDEAELLPDYLMEQLVSENAHKASQMHGTVADDNGLS